MNHFQNKQPHFFRFTLEGCAIDGQTNMTMNIDSDDFSKAQEQCLDFKKQLETNSAITNIRGNIRVLAKRG